MPDLELAATGVCIDECRDDNVFLYVPVYNGGSASAGTVSVRLIREDGGITNLNVVNDLAAGTGYVMGVLAVGVDDWGGGDLSIVVDDADVVRECVEDNNSWNLGPWPCAAQ
jgi:hypothetical protein